MKVMNRQGNTYTILYIVVMVVVVGAALAYAAMSLKPLQQANADADKMKQILASVRIVPAEGCVQTDFDRYITRQMLVDASGNATDGDAFAVDVAQESKKKDMTQRLLSVFECRLSDSQVKYILPVYGAGLWGPVWGYVSVDSDGKTVYGAYFAHQGETPGLGAEIDKPEFGAKFEGKNLFVDGRFRPVAVVKAGQKPADGAEYVDGISGGTITSKGVSDMLSNCLSPYEKFLETLNNR